MTRVPESHDPRAGRPDWIGFGTFSSGLAALVYGLIRAGQEDWTDQVVVGCLVAAAALLTLFVLSQAVQRHPMFDLTLLRKPTFVGGLIAAFSISASIFALFTYLVIYMQVVLGLDAIGTGVRFLFLSVASFFAAAIAGRLTSYVPAKWLIAPGFLVVGTGLMLLHGITVGSTWTHLIPGLIVAGRRHRHGEHAARLHRRRRGLRRPGRHGVRGELDVPPGRLRHRHRGPRVHLQPPDHRGVRLATGRRRPPRRRQRLGVGRDHQRSAERRLRRAPAHRARGHRALVDSLNHITLIAAVIAFAAAALCLVLIRQQDFVVQPGEAP